MSFLRLKTYNYDECFKWKLLIKRLYPSFPKDMVKYIGRFLLTFKWTDDEEIARFYINRTDLVSSDRLFYELLSNAIESYQRQKCFNPNSELKPIRVVMTNYTISIYNEGNPFPCLSNDTWIPERIFSKFSSDGIRRHQVGIQMVGLKSPSVTIDIINREESIAYSQTFRNYLKEIELPQTRTISKEGNSSTKVTFTTDEEINGNKINELYNMCRGLCFSSNIPISFSDTLNENSFLGSLNFDTSILGYAKFVLPYYFKFDNNYLTYEDENTRLFVCYSPKEPKSISFVNNISTPKGGVHVNVWMNNLIPNGQFWTNFTFILSVKLHNPRFNSQMKDKLEGPAPKVTVTEEMRETIASWIK